WMPIASAANFAQFGACLAIALKAKSGKTKAVALPSSLSAALGITEPAIFGVNLRFYKPFVAGMIGGAVGALVAAFMGIGANAYGVTGIPGYLTIEQPLQYTIVLAISAGIAFVLTNILWSEEAPAAKTTAAADAAPAAPAEVVMTSDAGDIVAPVAGKAIAREQIPDETFASGVLGDGVGIEPTDSTVYAPFDGTISTVAESKHAVGISGAGDMELLIHVGVDTVQMNGDGFTTFVAEGDEVKKGQKLLTFDREKIAKAGHPDVVVVLLTNSDDMENFKVTI
ncbi:MAG: glucose PTS transporter subunit IIA, partial [Lachnospiraceae bacterium]|nr:glucose PTS transporter subunit IIA [Lachnospiraceae bacterium]